MAHRSSTVTTLLSMALVLGATLLALPAQAAGSQRYVATSGTDTGDCSNSVSPCQTIGYAIGQAVAGSLTVSDTINIAAGVYLENLNIIKYIILQGPTSGAPATIDGNGGTTGQRVITADAPRVSINNLTLQNGNAGGLKGGGVYISGTAQISIRNSYIVSNTATEGGGIFAGNGAAVIIIRSGIQNNHATSGQGGGLLNDLGATATLTASALVNNTASGNGGGVSSSGPLTMTNSTVGDNTGGAGGGIYNNGAALSLNSVTVANNTSTTGGGGVASNGGAVGLQNTLLAANNGPAGSPDCSGTLTSQGYNLVGNNNGCAFSAGTGDQVGTNASPINPLIGPLALNRGFTLNHALLTNSPAINRGNPAGCTDNVGNPLTLDQRFEPRPVGPRCDVGSFEYGGGTMYLPFIKR